MEAEGEMGGVPLTPLMLHLQPPIPRRANMCNLFNLLQRKTSSLTVLHKHLTILTGLDLKERPGGRSTKDPGMQGWSNTPFLW